MRAMVGPKQAFLGALLFASLFPQGISLAFVREDTLSNSTAAAAELQAALRSAHARVQAEMKKAGMAPRRSSTIPEGFFNPLAGTFFNCLQTFLAGTEPVWSIFESIGGVKDSCSGEPGAADSKSCLEAKLGLSEDSISGLAYMLDFPTDCLGFSCGKRRSVSGEKEFVDPWNRNLVMFNAFNDAVTALLGVTTAKFTHDLQCDKESPGDSLGIDWSYLWHPSMVSLAPVVKEIREIVQSYYASSESTYGRLEKVASLLEWVAGTVQSFAEADMDKYNEKQPQKTDNSAESGCAAAKAHIAASAFALFTSLCKGIACYVGEWELYQDDAVRTAAGVPLIDKVGAVTPTINIDPPTINQGGLATLPDDLNIRPKSPPNRPLPNPYPPNLKIEVPPPGLSVDPSPPIGRDDPEQFPNVIKTECPHTKVDNDRCAGFASRYVSESDSPTHICYDQCCGEDADYLHNDAIKRTKWCTEGGRVRYKRMKSLTSIEDKRSPMARDAVSIERMRSLDSLKNIKTERQSTHRQINIDPTKTV